MTFYQNINTFKTPVKITDFLGEGIKFEFDTADDNCNYDLSKEIDFTNFPGSEEHLIPFDTPFNELKTKMTLVAEGVWKKIYKEAKDNSDFVNFSRHRVTYHRNLYMETEGHPFDSTYLNGKPDIINPYETDQYLEGILDSLSTMKEGEQSYFVISYRKMFKEKGCEPRVSPMADIFCDLKVLKIEEIGDQKIVENFNNESIGKQSFQDAKKICNELRLRAKNLFAHKKVNEAVKKYLQIKQMLEFCKTENDNDKNEKTDLLIQIMTNLGVCYNLLESPNKTMSIILQIEALCNISSNSKILFIKGKALRMLGEYKNAAIALEKANQLTPGNHKITNEMVMLDKDISDYKDITMKLSKNLFI